MHEAGRIGGLWVNSQAPPQETFESRLPHQQEIPQLKRTFDEKKCHNAYF